MAGRAKVFRGVLVFGGVAAPDVPAGQAHPQMDPPVLHLQTFLAAGGARLDIADLVEMGAPYLGHDSLPCSHLLEVLKHDKHTGRSLSHHADQFWFPLFRQMPVFRTRLVVTP
jgi:hypothetical protein